MRSMTMRRVAILAGLGFVFVAPAPMARADEPPQVSKDGLQLTKRTGTRLVYVRPNTTFTQFKRVAILDCGVEFSKDWLSDYNSSQVDPSRRIGDKDLQRAKTYLAAEFKQIFTDELVNKGGYQISANAAPDVLVLRPALVNIQVSAPDLMTPGRGSTFVEESGQMTLYLELWDSSNNTILARVMDARGSGDSYAQRATSVSNKAAADQILRSWASELRQRLDIATGKAGAQ